MAQQEFDGVGYHLEARGVWNGNATDAESRLQELEAPNYALRRVGPLAPITDTDAWIVADSWQTVDPQFGSYAFDYFVGWSVDSAFGGRDISLRYRISDGATEHYTEAFTANVSGDSGITYSLSGFDDFEITAALTLTIELQINLEGGFAGEEFTVEAHKFKFLKVTEQTGTGANSLP